MFCPADTRLSLSHRLALGLDCRAHADVTHRNREREAHVLDTWNGPYPPIDFVEKGPPLCFRVAKLPDIHVDVENTLRLEAKIRALSFGKAPHEQSGHREKHEATGDLGHHEEAADPVTMSAGWALT